MRLGVNCSRWTAQVRAALLALQPSILVATDPVDWDTVRACRDAFDMLVIYRPIVDGSRADNAEVEPRDLVAFTLEQIYHRRHLVDGVIGYNEVLTSGNVATQGPRELEFLRLMQAAGVSVVALNPGVGNVEPEHVPMLQDVFRESAAWGYHGYVREWGRDLDPVLEWPYHLLRPVDLWAPGHPYVDLGRGILTETGTYYDPPKTGISWSHYAYLLIAIHEYAVRAGYLGTAAFTLAGYEPWQTVQPWELGAHPDALDILVQYNRQQGGPAPRLTTPNGCVEAPGGTTDDSGDSGVQGGGTDMAEFQFGNKAEAERLAALGIDAGEPLMDEEYDQYGNSYQATSKGEMKYYVKLGLSYFFPKAG